MNDDRQTGARVASAIERGRQRRPGETHNYFSHIVEVACPEDLIGFVTAARRRDEPIFYWEKPHEDFVIAGYGSAWSVETSGVERFAAAASASRRLAAALTVESECAWLTTPPLLAGFAFGAAPPTGDTWRGFPAGRLTLPEVCIVRRGHRAALVRNVAICEDSNVAALAHQLQEGELPASSDIQPLSSAPQVVEQIDEPGGESWLAAVRDTIASIDAGLIDKLVLARSRRVNTAKSFDLERVLRQLRRRETGCAIFCTSVGDADFVGATPETLAALDRRQLQTYALAGTIQRGDTSSSDGLLRRELETSRKDRNEHDFVVRGITEELAPLCDSVTVDADPQVLSLHNLQHLRTSIRAEVHQGCHILEIVQALHPSPAVGGYPRQAALDLLAEREDFERGWYAAPIGWTTCSGDGELAVALRSGVVRGNDAHIFAGAGIVRSSEPADELAETTLKLGPMLAALTE